MQHCVDTRTSDPEAAAGRVSAVVYRFLRETRAGATAIAAAAVTVMTFGGTVLIVDHLWLGNQRDLLKAATDAAALAANLEFQNFSDTISDKDAAVRLHPIAERYVRFNVSGNLPEASRKNMVATLDVKVEVDQDLGSIDVTADADLGGTLLSKWLLDYSGPAEMQADSGVEGSLGTTEIVLAIDTTGSMDYSLDGSTRGGSTSRMAIVKQAAVDLVDVLESFPNSVIAVGLVPWTWRVRLNGSTRTLWKSKGWAVYPTERTYPHPTRAPRAATGICPRRSPCLRRADCPALQSLAGLPRHAPRE